MSLLLVMCLKVERLMRVYILMKLVNNYLNSKENILKKKKNILADSEGRFILEI